ncbi:hypothetical protein ACFC6U_11900 [Kitasatospora purpeofusca]|uniref:hypothetical protein n=1 Tax=Kitasatospora purpeofusca TaxID=67352 RepID=UPI0035E385CB
MTTHTIPVEAVIALPITAETPPDQVRETLFLLAQASFRLDLVLPDGTATSYHPAVTDARVRPLAAGDAAVLAAYGELLRLPPLLRRSQEAFHLWQAAAAGSGTAPAGTGDERAQARLEHAYLLAHAVALDVASLRDGADPASADAMEAANRLRALAGLVPADGGEALSWLRYTYASRLAGAVRS